MAYFRISLSDREFVFARASGCCEYCKFLSSFSHDAYHIDHIIPPQKGGNNELENVAFACDRCNSRKWTRTEWKDPQTSILSPLFHPRKDNWNDHFSWNNDFTLNRLDGYRQVYC